MSVAGADKRGQDSTVYLHTVVNLPGAEVIRVWGIGKHRPVGEGRWSMRVYLQWFNFSGKLTWSWGGKGLGKWLTPTPGRLVRGGGPCDAAPLTELAA